MLKITVKLKKSIKSLIEKFENGEGIELSHTDYIEVTPEVTALLGKTIEVELDHLDEDGEASDTLVAYPTGEDVVIHHSWIKSYNSENLLKKISTDKKFIKLTKSYLIDTETDTIVNIADIEVCTNCGNVLDTAHNICKELSKSCSFF